MPTACPSCSEPIIRAKAVDGIVALDPARLVYCISAPITKKPMASLAHQDRPDSRAMGVQYQYLAAHVCPPEKKLRRVK